ncbi:MAG: hypothetical protein KXJ50_01930 [Vulcanococcus sp.]|jgi:hypothetical protein|uniref:hypothetical protein n=1 Tax=Vulcanococcus sp. TaxID=2856995 RepID=UPI0025DB89D2|nr:hypothetical protein [Vulcanococcus sp.]MBW0173516.1 hypothetical protein [Vulcanococcus sp.]MBW0179813.1 hypothetical protein [Vulcanococcus sp.]
MSRSDGGDFSPRARLLLRVLTVLRWPLALVISSGVLGWVIATDDETVLKGPIRVQLSLDRPLPVNATVSGIDAPIRTQPLQATVQLPQGVQLAAPVAVAIPQLQKPLRADIAGAVNTTVVGPVEVNGAVQAQVCGSVDASVDGEVDAAITKPIQHERIRIGL